MTQLRGKVTRLKSKLISNQDQWVETFKSIQEPTQLLMVNAGESTIIIDVDESYRHNCLSLYFYYILSIFDDLIIIKILMVIECFKFHLFKLFKLIHGQ